MTIITAYNVSHTLYMSDILFMYRSIPFVIWIGVMVTFVSLVTMITIGQKISKPKLRIKPVWSLFSAFIDQDSYSFNTYDPRYARFIMLLSIFISTFSYFTGSYIGNSVSTDLVVIEKAYAPTTYKEIIDRKMIVGFSKMLPEYEKFRDSPLGSIEWELFKLRKYFHIQPESLIEMRDPLLGQRGALVGRRLITEGAGRATIALFSGNLPDLRGLMTKDPDARRYTNVFALSASVEEEKKMLMRKM